MRTISNVLAGRKFLTPVLDNRFNEFAKTRRNVSQVKFTSSLYIWHTKAMTALAEYGTRRLYKTTSFCSVLIVRSTS